MIRTYYVVTGLKSIKKVDCEEPEDGGVLIRVGWKQFRIGKDAFLEEASARRAIALQKRKRINALKLQLMQAEAIDPKKVRVLKMKVTGW